MELIQNNPYRIAGILSNATEKELQKQKGKIKAYAKVGKEIKSDYDFQILGNITRTEDSVNKAFSNVEQNQDKINYALFWFLDASPFDKTAIEYLINGDGDKAIEIWEKVTNGKEVNSRNFSAFNNLGTVKLLSKNRIDIKLAIEAKFKLIESESFENFVHSVADETFTIDNEKQIKKLVDVLLSQFKSQYTIGVTLDLFIDCNATTQQYLSEKFTEEPLHEIERERESCKKERKNKPSKAFQSGLNLFTNTKENLSILKSILNEQDLKYKAVADQLANEIMQCGIDYFNDNQENDSSEDFLEMAQKLTRYANSIAIGKLTKDRAKDSLASLDEMKDQEVSQAILLLQSIKDAYEANETKVKQQVNDIKNEVDFKLGYKTINQSAIDDAIKNSLDWNKVNSLLKEILSAKDLVKIKGSSNSLLKEEFIELIYWLQKFSQSKHEITSIINKYKNIPPNLTFNILSSKITNTDNYPLYTKFIKYVGLNINIKATENTSFTFYIKYINPNGTINRNSKTSPINYTHKIDKTINSQTESLDLSGWGNSDKCTFSVGENLIEVYVDEYLIHRKSFVVDLAPSEKIAIELKKAEKVLITIKNTQYFKYDLENAHHKMKELNKFKLFRGSFEKHSQIQSQQEHILQLVERANREKKKRIIEQEELIYKFRMALSATKY
jgi:hypothetical protein